MTKKNNLEIPDHCAKDISNMPRCGKTIQCSFCTKPVTDLSKSTTKQVTEFTEKNPGACIVLHKRHHAGHEKSYKWINKIESFFYALYLKRIAVGVCAFLIFATGCASRKKPHHFVGKFKTTPAPDGDNSSFKE